MPPNAARLMPGAPVADRIFDDIRSRVRALRARVVVPSLATILVGDDDASAGYIRVKQRRAELRAPGDHLLPRLDEPRVLHGAQDAYGGKPEYMGLTNDTAYAVFPDGRTFIMEGKLAQEAFYKALGRQAKEAGAPIGIPGWQPTVVKPPANTSTR